MVNFPDDTAPAQQLTGETVSYGEPISPKQNKFKEAFRSLGVFRYILPLILIIALPGVVLIAQQQQQNQSEASTATILSFAPVSNSSSPIKVNAGDMVFLDIVLDPGKNVVGSLDIAIRYDEKNLKFINKNHIQVIGNVTMKKNPTFEKRDNKDAIVFRLETPPIKNKRKVATIRFQAKQPISDRELTQIGFGSRTEVHAIKTDKRAGKNLLSSALPAVISIQKNGIIIPETSSSASPSATASPSADTYLTLSPSLRVPTESPCSICAADVNDDKKVTADDYTGVSKSFSTCYGKNPLPDGCSQYDVDKNKSVDEFDLNCVKRNMDKVCSQ